MIPCMEAKHVHFIDEPSLGLSDADFVHRMWADDENFYPGDDENSEDDDCEDEDLDSDDSEGNSIIDGYCEHESSRPISAYFRDASPEL
jgi:hypothetical protein